MTKARDEGAGGRQGGEDEGGVRGESNKMAAEGKLISPPSRYLLRRPPLFSLTLTWTHHKPEGLQLGFPVSAPVEYFDLRIVSRSPLSRCRPPTASTTVRRPTLRRRPRLSPEPHLNRRIRSRSRRPPQPQLQPKPQMTLEPPTFFSSCASAVGARRTEMTRTGLFGY